MPPRLPDENEKRAIPGATLRARKLRHEQSPVERKLWWILRDRRLGGYKFRRQVPIGRYFADFCCLEQKMIIEVDGQHHQDSGPYDLERQKFLEEAGFRIVRFWAREVLYERERVLQQILDSLGDPLIRP